MKRNKDVSNKKSRNIDKNSRNIEQILKYREQLDLELHPSSMDNSKTPLVPWTKISSSGPRQIISWARKFNTSSFGVTLSKCKTNYLVLDLDIKNGVNGYKSIVKMPGYSPGDLDNTFSVKTPSGGDHFWFTSDQPIEGKTSFLNGIDILGTNHRVIAPGSQLANGDEYKVVADFTVQLAPEWLLIALQTSKPTAKNVVYKPDSQVKGNVEDLRELLARIDPDIEYKNWRDICFAALNHFGFTEQVPAPRAAALRPSS